MAANKSKANCTLWLDNLSSVEATRENGRSVMHCAFVEVWAILGSRGEDFFVDDCARLLILRSLACDELDEPQNPCDVRVDDDGGGVGSRPHLLTRSRGGPGHGTLR